MKKIRLFLVILSLIFQTMPMARDHRKNMRAFHKHQLRFSSPRPQKEYAHHDQPRISHYDLKELICAQQKSVSTPLFDLRIFKGIDKKIMRILCHALLFQTTLASLRRPAELRNPWETLHRTLPGDSFIPEDDLLNLPTADQEKKWEQTREQSQIPYPIIINKIRFFGPIAICHNMSFDIPRHVIRLILEAQKVCGIKDSRLKTVQCNPIILDDRNITGLMIPNKTELNPQFVKMIEKEQGYTFTPDQQPSVMLFNDKMLPTYGALKGVLFHEIEHFHQYHHHNGVVRTINPIKYPKGYEQEATIEALYHLNCSQCAEEFVEIFHDKPNEYPTHQEGIEILGTLNFPHLCGYHQCRKEGFSHEECLEQIDNGIIDV